MSRHACLRPALVGAWLALAGCAGSGAALRAPVPEQDRLAAQELLERAASALLGAGEPGAALRDLEAGLTRNPGDVQARVLAAWAAEQLGEDERALEHLLAGLAVPHPLLEYAMMEAYWLANSRREARALAARLEELVELGETPHAVRARALNTLGLCRRALGNEAAAQAAFRALGLVQDFWVAGPFDNDQNAGYDTAYPPEQGVASYQARYPGKLREVGWRRVEHFDFDGRVNLASLLDPARWAAAYLATAIEVERERPVALRLAAFRGLKIWLNGELLLADDEATSPVLDQYVVGAVLRPGWNRLLVKVCQREGPWQLRLRVTEPDGAPAAGLHFDATRFPGPEPPRAEAPATSRPQVDRGLADHLPDLAPPALRDALEATWARRLGFVKRATERGTAFAKDHPGAFGYLLLSQIHQAAENPGSALKALAEAERLAPALPAVVIARVRHEQAHRRLERAMRLLAPLRESRPELLDAELLYLDLLAGRGFHEEALRLARDAIRREPDRAWLWRLLAGQHVALKQPVEARRAYRRALELQPDHAATFDRLVDLALAAGDTTEALALARRKARLYPAAVGSALREADILLAAGDPLQALEVHARLLRISPDYGLLHRRRGDALIRLGRREEAVRAYQTALELQPDNSGLRDYLDFLVHRPDPVLARYDRQEIEALLGQAVDPARYPDADAVFVLDDQVTHLFADGSAKHQVRQIYTVLTEQGRKAFDHFRVPNTASFRLDAAEVLQPDGGRQEASSIQPGVIHFPSLQPGSTVHVAYRYDQASSSWMQEHFDESYFFQGTYPVLDSRWVLAVPEGRELRVLKRGEAIEEQIELRDGERVYLWRARDMPRLHPEPNSPSTRELAASVLVTTVPSWEVLARWQNSLIQDQFDITLPIREKTRELVRAARTPLEKLDAIYRFVAREVRYVDHDAGIFGKKPNKAVEVFDNRFGDCKDKATLMIAMLREVGILAHYAGVRTADRGPIFWEVPSAQTNHIITYLPAQEGIPEPLFVDGTSRFGHVLDLPWNDQGLRALVLDGKGHQVIETPSLPPSHSSLEVRLEAQLAPRGLRLEGQETWSGVWAHRMRGRLQNEGKQGEEISGLLNRRFRGAQVERFKLRGIQDLEPQAGADYALFVPDRVRAEGDSLRLQLLWPINLAAYLAPRPERHNDVEILTPFEERSQIRLALPAGMAVSKLPEEVRLSGPLFDYQRSCRSADQQVTCTRTLTVRRGRLPLAEYGQLRAAAMQLDQAEEQDLVLAPAPAAAAGR